MIKAVLVKQAFYFHRAWVWLSAGTLLLFVLSAFCHLLLTWTGPQTAINKPPQQVFNGGQLAAIPAILRQQDIQQAGMIKLVPSEQGAVLQVTQDRLAPRRYFDLDTGNEIQGQDEQQARWLANYYLNDSSRIIQSMTFQTTFDDEYPWVNRLLPVYKAVYAGDDELTLYIHTETQALASISNHWKRNVQTVFRQLHTWAWLENYRHGRVILMMIFLSSLLVMILAGFSLLYLFKRHGSQQTPRRAHRVLAHVVGIPLLGFCTSGIYHLLHSEYAEVSRDFNLSQPLLLEQDRFRVSSRALSPEQALHSVALIRAGNELWFRASLVENPSMGVGEHDHHHDEKSIRQQRFDGIAREQGGLYVGADGQAMTDMTDEKLARLLAMDYLGVANTAILSVEKVTHFGPDYDFRNKRLPVWRVEINNAARDILFVDVASGLLVDRVNRVARMEGYSFSFLHKWNFLTFPLGREKRDALIVLVLLGTLVLAGLGVVLRTLAASRR